MLENKEVPKRVIDPFGYIYFIKVEKGVPFIHKYPINIVERQNRDVLLIKFNEDKNFHRSRELGISDSWVRYEHRGENWTEDCRCEIITKNVQFDTNLYYLTLEEAKVKLEFVKLELIEKAEKEIEELKELILKISIAE